VTDDGVAEPVTVKWSQVSGTGGVLFGSPTSLQTTATFTRPGAYVVRLTAFDGQLSASADVTVTVGGQVLMLVNSSTLTAGESLLKSIVQSFGFTVNVGLAANAVEADATGKALIIVAPSAKSTDMGTKFQLAATPVISFVGGEWSSLLLANSVGTTTTGTESQLALVGTHPILGTLSGTVPISTSASNYFFGSPATGAVRVGNVPSTGQAVLFAYEKNAQILGTFARERRVAMGWSAVTVAGLNSNGIYLFDRAMAWAAHFNSPPVVSAGSDITVSSTGPVTVNLSGTVTDDLLTGTLNISWSGPAGVAFGNASSLATTAQLPGPGTYSLVLKADDGQFAPTSTMTVTVIGPPTVNAGPDLTIMLPNTASLHGTAVDPTTGSTPAVQWSVQNGDGAVTFSSPGTLDTTATFTVSGTYVLALTASNASYSRTDTTTVTVQIDGSPAVLLVTGAGTHPGDDAIVTRLGSLGYVTSVKTDATVSAADAVDKAVVFVTGTASASVGPIFADVAVPMISAQPLAFDALGLTSALSGTGSGVATGESSVRILDGTHPLSASLSGQPSVVLSAASLGWGEPADGAARAVALAGSDHPAVFGYEQGTRMVGRTAAARRVGLFTYGETSASLTTEGGSLLEAAVAWAVGRLAPPVFSPAPGSFSSSPVSVSLSSSTPNVEIHYTLDGSEPTATSALYSSPLSLATTTTLKAAAFRVGRGASASATGIYQIVLGTLPAPTLSPPAGDYPSTQNLTLSVPASGAEIRYTLDGSEPTQASFLYSAPIPVADTTTLKARAFKTDFGPSPLVTAYYTFDPDHDGLSNAQEALLGTDPNNADTNGDGIPDGAEVALGLDPKNMDMDGDGVPNAVERAQGTDPFKADTDGDGVPDGVDCFPLDPTRWQCPPPNPGDTTPPVITLTEPVGARLISSQP
jgi:hypothetical protein